MDCRKSNENASKSVESVTPIAQHNLTDKVFDKVDLLPAPAQIAIQKSQSQHRLTLD